MSLLLYSLGDRQMQAKRTVSTSYTRELCLSEPPFVSEVLVRKTKELGDGTVELVSQFLGHRVNEHCLSHDATVREEIWLVGGHQYNSFVVHAKRDVGIVVKRGDVFAKRLACRASCHPGKWRDLQQLLSAPAGSYIDLLS